MRSSRCEGLSERWGGLAALCTADELLFLLGTLTGGGGRGGEEGGIVHVIFARWTRVSRGK